MQNSIGQDTSITQAHHCYFPLPWVAPDLVVGFAGCGIIVISSLIFNGFRSESFDLDDGDAGAFFLSITLFATTLCAEYTWFSNCLYIPNVAVQTVHLYDRCAGFNVIPWSRATWFNNFHWYTCEINTHSSQLLIHRSCLCLCSSLSLENKWVLLEKTY